jgi:hypothetical protein
MPHLFEVVHDLRTGEEAIRRRAYGVIEIAQGRLVRIVLRPWPKIFTSDDVLLRGQFSHRGLLRDACRLYFNQPWGHRNFLALKYIVSHLGTTFATIQRAMQVLDEVARIKRSDAIVAHVSNPNISDRLMERWGWERHLESSNRRHFIKRFYGVYPESRMREPRPSVTNDRPQVAGTSLTSN